ncbi:hypothetical protein FCH31_15625 [Lelliottia amnigena]|nr:hypothetical protein [Lelliottia amnigena]
MSLMGEKRRLLYWKFRRTIREKRARRAIAALLLRILTKINKIIRSSTGFLVVRCYQSLLFDWS